MRELGYIVGKNLIVERRFADGKLERLPSLAADLVQLKVDVIVAESSSAIAAQKATTTIPIVMTIAARSAAQWICEELGTTRRQYHRALDHERRYRR